MVIYDKVKKSIKIAVFSLEEDILNKVTEELENREFNVVKYKDLEKVRNSIIKNRIKIIVINDPQYVDFINNLNEDICIVLLTDDEKNIQKYNKLNIQNSVTLDSLSDELLYSLRIVSQEQKIDFQKYKMNIVSNLVESISHKVQANLLIVGASLDVIKMFAEDKEISSNVQKNSVLENIYDKNAISLNKANMLLQVMANATTISSESIMQSKDIIELIKLITDEYIIEKGATLNISEKLKNGIYMQGPLNDIIFIICSLIKELVQNTGLELELVLREDENNWYFEINTTNNIELNNSIVKLFGFITYIKDVSYKTNQNNISIQLEK